MISRKKKMEMARQMLRMHTVINHNMKNQRRSAQKRHQESGGLVSMLTQGKQVLE